MILITKNTAPHNFGTAAVVLYWHECQAASKEVFASVTDFDLLLTL